MGAEQAGNLPTVHEGQRLMDEVVALVVERLGVYADYVEYDPPLNYEDAAATTMREAVCTIRALVAANSVLAAAHNDTLAKLREAVEVMRTVDAMIYNDNGDVTWSPLQIRSAIRAFLATMEKPRDP